jgi:hypothetical protein
MANGTIARPKVSMIMNKHDETGLRENAGEALEPMLLDPCIAMGDGDRGKRARSLGRQEEPATETIPALDREFNVAPLDHEVLLGSRAHAECARATTDRRAIA